ncbi:hypothetical protein GCM10023091_00390 [Ravibacter arvi]|uniref:Lanthionine synthetase-like protein n=1 Tax=Ravibacter arvi TaxID=2051041 RepID=A0ABP8LJ86_9BACT
MVGCSSTRDIISQVENIYRIIKENISFIKSDKGALCNSAGLSIFLYNYSQIFSNCESKRLADKVIENLFDKDLEFEYSDAGTVSFCSGVIGSGWLMTYLSDSGYCEIEQDMVELDCIAELFFIKTIEAGNYDFLHGASGALRYLLGRPKDELTIHAIIRMTRKLLDAACNTDEFLFWPSYEFKTKSIKSGVINLGLSHGTPSILAILSAVYEYLDQNEFLVDYIRKCAYTILSCKNRGDTFSLYPYQCDIGAFNSSNSRLGWCYGDLGVAVSLWSAGKILSDNYILNEAILAIRSASKICDTEMGLVKDAAICHGASGISHILYNFYLETNEKEFLLSSNYWYNRTICYLEPVRNLITARTNWNSTFGYNNRFGLLEGISGVGISLLNRIYPSMPIWDKCLLLRN